ncbi:Phenylalanyl-tRNA_synthetase beta chain [Hexamita inflata]|uniref:phenylalanine--tRNA ligase n=1 Tax=Hexamita inflata TaxID=28002 RepID=A0AA86Q565_9EUKA|nr:Phenylalanyl-tRNA synthetase beta chain [Hexamita inflata]
MPNVSCIKGELMKLIGKEYTDEEFEEIMISYGMELDEIVEEPERHSTVPVKTYKIDVGANRADLLCIEGIARALKVFIENGKPESFTVQAPKYTIEVDNKVGQIRPYVVSAVVHNVKFTQRAYNSFIDHQDKLHHNVCRRRTLVAIGTHDLKKINASKITYTGEKPEDVIFTALNQTEKTNGRQLFDILKEDKKLGEYLSIIDKSEVWPVIRDGNGEVLSLPPIINSEYSKISLDTTDIFIESTATDLQKAYIALNAVINGICMHSSTPLEVEAVNVHYNDMKFVPLLSKPTDVVPHLESKQMTVTMKYIRTIVGVDLSPEQAINYLFKMSIIVTKLSDDELVCNVPFQRADVLHPIDLVEDVAIGFGYNEIAQHYSNYPFTATIGSTLVDYRQGENLRIECASCGYVEMLLFTLCSKEDEIFGQQDVALSNAKTSTFTHGRSSLIPGLMKAASFNQFRQLPVQLFECSDVFKLDNAADNDTGVTTVKKLAALYGGVSDGFGNIHGLLDKVGQRLNCQFTLKREDHEICIKGRRAGVYVGEKRVGWIGVPSIDILNAYKVPFPVTVFEIDV